MRGRGGDRPFGGAGAGGGQGPGVTGREPDRGEGISPWFTAGARVTGGSPAAHRQDPQQAQQAQEARQPQQQAPGEPAPRSAPPPRSRGVGDTAVMPVIGDASQAPRPPQASQASEAPQAPDTPAAPDVSAAPGAFDEPSAPSPELTPPVPSGPGRAERRRAAAAAAKKGRGGRRQPPTASAAAAGEPGRPLTRVEARAAARAAKDSPAVIASRAMGELFITFGVVMLLFVTYQLWWTNVRAGMEAGKEKQRIQQSFTDTERAPGAFRPGEGFAIMYIPKLDVVVPVAEGIDKKKVLDRGMVGRYAEGRLKTAMPSDRTGNFGVAGHRNTHGEPFRYINRLKPGDPIVVETRDAYYTYEMASILPQTAPSNVAVLDPVPRGSGFTGPGRYITLTTCTPEFTSTYRMIVWGRMVEERPRSKGKPDALVG
ncbi:class E sortase [Streptomyces tsukubensis]|uniref:class E sortase n=1 Tax=Streptomyces tsukubensis TaxID=83656 RepID=UPI0036C96277